MAGVQKNMEFVAMSSIEKIPTEQDLRCADWVATEKIHGSSFQLYTQDGTNVHVGSRRRNVDHESHFLKCSLDDLLKDYRVMVSKLWEIVRHGDRWAAFRQTYADNVKNEENDDKTNNDNVHSNAMSVTDKNIHYNSHKEDSVRKGGDKNDNKIDREDQPESAINNKTDREESNHNIIVENDETRIHSDEQTQSCRQTSSSIRTSEVNDVFSGKTEEDGSTTSSPTQRRHSEETSSSIAKMEHNNKFFEKCNIRIYGELYGGGGVNRDVKTAVQKEIIYCDNFRFYVYGLTINRKWLTIAELNELCREAGFLYYAHAVNPEPKATVDELKQWLVETGFMGSRSSFTDREVGADKTHIEGVVLTPLTKPDYKLHAIKFLAPAFNDVRQAQLGKKVTTVYCTKQRYHSVISKLDIGERLDTELVVELFTQDILKESKKPAGVKLRDKWRKIVVGWLKEDGYYNNTSNAETMGDTTATGARDTVVSVRNVKEANGGIQKTFVERSVGELEKAVQMVEVAKEEVVHGAMNEGRWGREKANYGAKEEEVREAMVELCGLWDEGANDNNDNVMENSIRETEGIDNIMMQEEQGARMAEGAATSRAADGSDVREKEGDVSGEEQQNTKEEIQDTVRMRTKTNRRFFIELPLFILVNVLLAFVAWCYNIHHHGVEEDLLSDDDIITQQWFL